MSRLRETRVTTSLKSCFDCHFELLLRLGQLRLQVDERRVFSTEKNSANVDRRLEKRHGLAPLLQLEEAQRLELVNVRDLQRHLAVHVLANAQSVLELVQSFGKLLAAPVNVADEIVALAALGVFVRQLRSPDCERLASVLECLVELALFLEHVADVLVARSDAGVLLRLLEDSQRRDKLLHRFVELVLVAQDGADVEEKIGSACRLAFCSQSDRESHRVVLHRLVVLALLSQKDANVVVANFDAFLVVARRLAVNLERTRTHRKRLIHSSKPLEYRRQVHVHERHVRVVVADQRLADLQSRLVVRHSRVILGQVRCHVAKQVQRRRLVQAAVGGQRQSTLRKLLRQFKRFRFAHIRRRKQKRVDSV